MLANKIEIKFDVDHSTSRSELQSELNRDAICECDFDLKTIAQM